MSALNLLSVIAPAVPTTLQGSSGEAAPGFQSLLAAQSSPAGLSGEDVPASGAKPGPAEIRGLDEAKTTDTTAIGFLLTPTQLPVPLVLPAADGSAATGQAKAPAAGSGGGNAEPTTLPPAGTETPDAPPTTPLAPVDKARGAKTNEPQIQPAVPDFGGVPARLSDFLAARTETTARTVAMAEAVEAQAEARVGTAPAPTPPSGLAVAAPPPPLRPLAERTSRPAETPATRPGEPASVADPAKAAAAAMTTAVAPADQPARPADLLVAAVAGHAASGNGSDDQASDQAPVSEASAAPTQAPAAARETALSQLSRAAVEATAQIAAQILRRLEGRSTRFEMALTPDELGRVDVKLDIDSEGRLNARLAFDNPAAATDLRGRADELRRQLEDAGFHLAEDAFEFTDRDSGSSAFDRGQDARHGSARAFANASRLNTEIDLAQPPRWLSLSLTPSGLDMKV